WDKTVRVWDAERGVELASLCGHTAWVNCVAASPDGRRIVSGSGSPGVQDNTVRVWDVESREQLACLRGHTGLVESVAISPDGGRIVSGSWDRTVRVWDAESGEEVACLRQEGSVLRVVISPDGRRIVSGLGDGTAQVWDAASYQLLRVMEGPADVTAVAGGVEEYPFQAVRRGLETTIEDTATGRAVAWFTLALYHTVAPPSRRIWAGIPTRGGYLGIIALEGPPEVHAPKTVTPTRLWLMDNDRGDSGEAILGHWDDRLTVLCPWHGGRVQVTPEMLGAEIACTKCGEPLRLNDFVCDWSDRM
ncbi:MAG: WD40 repeat domain-containing protein, partial [Armatimonadota bacterium]